MRICKPVWLEGASLPYIESTEVLVQERHHNADEAVEECLAVLQHDALKRPLVVRLERLHVLGEQPVRHAKDRDVWSSITEREGVNRHKGLLCSMYVLSGD